MNPFSFIFVKHIIHYLNQKVNKLLSSKFTSLSSKARIKISKKRKNEQVSYSFIFVKHIISYLNLKVNMFLSSEFTYLSSKFI